MSIIIQKRDLSLLGFILCMRVGDSDVLAANYFSSFKGFNRRIKKLSSLDFIKRTDDKTINGHTVINLTNKGYKYYKGLSHQDVPKLVRSKVNVTKLHERYVAISRVVMEKEIKGLKWLSEREILKSLSLEQSSNSNSFLPDGIYLNEKNKKVAFELELSVKTRKKIDEKVECHINYINQGIFEKVHFVCESDSIYNYINNRYSNELDFIITQRFSHFNLEYKKILKQLKGGK